MKYLVILVAGPCRCDLSTTSALDVKKHNKTYSESIDLFVGDVLSCNHVTHDSINKHIMLQLQSLYATSPPTSFLWG